MSVPGTTNHSRTYKRIFPFIPGEIVDLNGTDGLRGQIGFGSPPSWTGEPCPSPPDPITRATGWAPVMSSFSYVTLGNEDPHNIRIIFGETRVDLGRFKGGTVPVPTPFWQQLFFDEPGVRFIYASGVPIPVSEETGNPFNIRIITQGRLDPTMVVISWKWARFLRDIDRGILESIDNKIPEVSHQ